MRINKLTLGALRYIYDENKQLKSQLQQKENIIKEVREYIKENCIDDEFEINLTFKERNIKKVLEILDKENNL